MTDTTTAPIKGPIFIMGFPRSGTSGLASGLSKLPGFAAHGPEGHFIYLLGDGVVSINDNNLNPNSIVRDPGPKAAFLAAIAKGIDDAYCTASGATSHMWIDKTPDLAQVRAIPALLALFPQAWFFYIYRDAASAVRSNMATWPDQLVGQEMQVAQRWRQCQATWRENRSLIPADRWLEIYQPDLRSTPETVVAEIGAMMGLTDKTVRKLDVFWSKNRQVNRPRGDAAAAYDAITLDDGLADRITATCADEMAHWPRLQPLVAEAEARNPGPFARIRSALGRGGKAAAPAAGTDDPDPAAPLPPLTSPAAPPPRPAPPAPVAATADPALKTRSPVAPGEGLGRVAFTGHQFHRRTGSSDFFLDLLTAAGAEVTRLDYETPESYDYTGLLAQDFDHRIFWQSEEILARSRHLFAGRNIVIPMYDAARQRPVEYWQGFAGDVFISFSSTLHNTLQGAGCDSVLVQYWPAPAQRAWDAKTPLSAFYWDRRPGEAYDARAVLTACHRLGIPQLHIHLAFDFGGDKARRRTELRQFCDRNGITTDIVFSEWYDSKADLAKAIHAHPVYFAARSHEGIGMSFLEAMAHGQVVIGRNAATLNEYIANGSNGYLLDADFNIPRDAAVFRDSLLEMSDRTLDAVAEGHAQWQQDAHRLVAFLRTGRVNGHTDAGADFERALRVAAGTRVAPPQPVQDQQDGPRT